jgi:hypothetical protein
MAQSTKDMVVSTTIKPFEKAHIEKKMDQIY